MFEQNKSTAIWLHQDFQAVRNELILLNFIRSNKSIQNINIKWKAWSEIVEKLIVITANQVEIIADQTENTADQTPTKLKTTVEQAK